MGKGGQSGAVKRQKPGREKRGRAAAAVAVAVGVERRAT